LPGELNWLYLNSPGKPPGYFLDKRSEIQLLNASNS